MNASRRLFVVALFAVCAAIGTVYWWYCHAVRKYEDTADMLLRVATNRCDELWRNGIQADKWGRTLFVSRKVPYPISIRSAGYDGVLFTPDDISMQITAETNSCYSVSLEWEFGFHSSRFLNVEYSSDCH